MTSINPNRPAPTFQPTQSTVPANRPASAPQPQAPAQQPPEAQAAAERNRDSFSPAAALRPSGRARVTTQGDNFVLEAQGQVGNRGSTPRGGVPTRLGTANAGGSFGLQGSLRVEVPREGATDAIRNGQLPNPASPETWPVGTRARAEVQGQAGFNAGLRAGPGRLGERLGLSTSYDRTQTQRYEVQRTSEDTVRATVTSDGRQRDATNIRGLEGRQDQRLGHTQSADFNIRTPEGRAAYDDFMRTGQLPRENGAGVSNVNRTDTLDQTREGRVLGREVATTERQTRLTADGAGDQTVRQTDRNVAGSTQSTEMQVGADGNGRARTAINDSVVATTTTRPGQPPETSYELTFTDPNAAAMARGAFSSDDAAASGTGPFTARLNEQQARALVERTMGQGLQGGQQALDRAFRTLSTNGQQTFATTLYNSTVDTRNPNAARRPLESMPPEAAAPAQPRTPAPAQPRPPAETVPMS
ncbi:hypothetical protein D7Y27_14635 [Corallococcus sp. AB004]|uniref:hypothetical protein n=1 Tax=Corallococcus exiguus TaxID=83462 RepID=UPI000EA065C8|nr:hypothetical protein [Corallococcus exiguus]NPC72640.1 hypothetical protein [Corallococcus exiguus]RKI43826.1 hypothetical protein D7Y27_14635 [Corallococcus sp. AB004]